MCSKEEITREIIRTGKVGIYDCLESKTLSRGQIETIEADIRLLRRAIAQLIVKLPIKEIVEILEEVQ